MKIFVWILPVLFYHLFCLELTTSPLSACLWLKIFDLARGWFGMFVVLPSGVVPSTVPISLSFECEKFQPRSWASERGKSQLRVWASKRGKSQLWSRDHMCLRVGENPSNRAAKQGLWEVEIPATKLGLRVRKVPHRSNMDVCRRTFVTAYHLFTPLGELQYGTHTSM